MALLVKDQVAYTGERFMRIVPLNYIHIFSVVCLLEVVLRKFYFSSNIKNLDNQFFSFTVCVIGFHAGSQAKFAFPFILIAMVPLRWYILPLFIKPKRGNTDYMEYLDGVH